MSEPEKIIGLPQIEEYVNGYAKRRAQTHGVRGDIFTVHLVRQIKGRGQMSIVGGEHVHIYLLWPEVQSYVNTELDNAFRWIQRKGLYTPLFPATYAWFHNEAKEAKRWTKQKLGDDASEAIGALIPKYRLAVTTTTTIEVRDKLTGEKVYGETHKLGDYRDAPTYLWSRLSQQLFDQELLASIQPEEPVAASETPLLDEALSENERQ